MMQRQRWLVVGLVVLLCGIGLGTLATEGLGAAGRTPTAPTATPGPNQGAPLILTPAVTLWPLATRRPSPEPTPAPGTGISPPTYFPARGNETAPIATAPELPAPPVIQVRDSHGVLHTLPVLPVDRAH